MLTTFSKNITLLNFLLGNIIQQRSLPKVPLIIILLLFTLLVCLGWFEPLLAALGLMLKLLVALFWCHNVSAGVAGLVLATVGCLGFDVESLWLSSYCWLCFGVTMLVWLGWFWPLLAALGLMLRACGFQALVGFVLVSQCLCWCGWAGLGHCWLPWV